jgi:hypothetical protein
MSAPTEGVKNEGAQAAKKAGTGKFASGRALFTMVK